MPAGARTTQCERRSSSTVTLSMFSMISAQIAEVAPERIQLVARSVDRHGSFYEFLRFVRCVVAGDIGHSMIRQHIDDATKAPPDIAGVSTERSHADHPEHGDAGERRDRETNVWTSAMQVHSNVAVAPVCSNHRQGNAS